MYHIEMVDGAVVAESRISSISREGEFWW